MGNFGLTEKCNTEKGKRKCKGGLKMVQAEKKDEQENATTTELARPNIYTQERNSWLTSKRLLKESDR